MTHGATERSLQYAVMKKGPGPEVVAETLLEIVSSNNPRLRYLIGQQAKTVARLRRFLPARMYEQGVRRTFLLDSTAPAAASSTSTRS